MTTLSELRERLENAEGPDRELDADICAALRFKRDGGRKWLWANFPEWRHGPQRGHVEVVHNDGIGGAHWASDPVTASLDAAIALVEAMMPGWEWKIHANHFNWRAELFEREERHDPISAEGATRDGGPAIALLLALLSALEKESAE